MDRAHGLPLVPHASYTDAAPTHDTLWNEQPAYPHTGEGQDYHTGNASHMYLAPSGDTSIQPRASDVSVPYDKRYADDSHAGPYDEPEFDNAYTARPRQRTRRSSRGFWSYEDRHAFRQQPLWKQILRILAFILVIGFIFAVCVVMLIVLFLRPPNVALTRLQTPQSPTQVNLGNDQLSFNASVSAVVSNPNYVAAKLWKVEATAYDAHAKTMSVGNCSLYDVKIGARENTTLTIPCTIAYNPKLDTNQAVAKDLLQRCSSNQQLDILLNVHLGIQFLAFHIPVSINPTLSAACPITPDQIKKVVGQNTAGILGALGGTSKRDHLPVPPDTIQQMARGLFQSAHAYLRRLGPASAHDTL